jgi:hypothetical protein
MRSLLILLLAVACTAADRKQLFNGKDMTGWQFLPSSLGSKGFQVENGFLRTGGAKGLLWYTGEKIGNATIRVVFKMSNNDGNSGIFIRIPEAPRSEGDAIHKGIEVQIDNRDNDWHCTGTLYSMTKAMARPSKPAGEWNTMDISLDGLRTVVKVNGVLVTDYDGVSPVPERKQPWEPQRGPRPASGYIGLQNHDERSVIYFREISVEPLHKKS